jgi:plasmid stability protein
LDDNVIRRQRSRAKRKGVSLEQHLRDVVSQDAAKVSAGEWLKEIDELKARYRVQPAAIDSATLIREGRDDLDSKWRT